MQRSGLDLFPSVNATARCTSRLRSLGAARPAMTCALAVSSTVALLANRSFLPLPTRNCTLRARLQTAHQEVLAIRQA